MLDFADADAVEATHEEEQLQDCKENGFRKAEEVINPSKPPEQKAEKKIECTEEVGSDQHGTADFLDVMAKARIKVLAFDIVSKIKDYSNVRLWKLYESIRGDDSRPKMRAIVKAIVYERYLPDVMSVAEKYSRRRLPRKSLASADDVHQSAIKAHLEGMEKYSHTFGTTYMQFLNASGKSRVIGRIIDDLRRLQDLPRDVSFKRRNWKKKIEALAHKLGKWPNIDEIADEYGEEAGEISSDPLFEASVVNQVDDGEGNAMSMSDFPLEKKVGRGSPSGVKYSSKEEEILSYIPDEKIRYIISAYYFKSMVNGDIANELKMSISTVSTLRRRGETMLRARLTRDQFEDIFRRHS